MEPFHLLCPQVGKEEYWALEVTKAQRGLPAGRYGLVELYCPRPECDCRNLHLNVVGGDPPQQLATINFSLDPDGFRSMGLGRAFLDPLNVQTEYSPALLELFRGNLMGRPEFVERCEKHLKMAKESGRRE